MRTGRRFSLALPLSADGPQTGVVPGRLNPLRTMIAIHDPLIGDPDEVGGLGSPVNPVAVT